MTVLRPLAEAPQYVVTDDGRIFREVKAADDGKGYLRVTISIGGKRLSRRLSVLIAKTFLGQPGDGLQVRHLNGDPTDNRVENLAWGTPQENIDDRTEHGTTARKERHGCAVLTQVEVDEMRAYAEAGVSRRRLSNQFGVSKRQVGRILKGQSWRPEIDRRIKTGEQ